MDLTTYLRSPSWDTYPVWATWVESPGLTPLVAVQIGLDAQEDGHRFTVHSRASDGPEILSSVVADAGSLGFSVGAGMEFWVTRDADGASSLAGGGAWVADPSQTTTGSDQIAVFYGSANGVFPDPPERGYALEPQTFRVHWQRAAHAFTVWMSDGYRTVVAAESVSWQQLAMSSGGGALWNPLDVFTFTVPTDPTRAWWLRDDTTGEVFPSGQTDVLDGWKPLTAEPEWLLPSPCGCRAGAAETSAFGRERGLRKPRARAAPGAC